MFANTATGPLTPPHSAASPPPSASACDRPLPPASLTAEATILFNDLVTRVSDPSDPDEIALAMPLVEYNLKKRLRDATANPGAGKHGA